MQHNAPTESIKKVLGAAREIAEYLDEYLDKQEWFPLSIGLQNGASVESSLFVLSACPAAAGPPVSNEPHPLHVATEHGAPTGAVEALLEADVAAAGFADKEGLLALHHGAEHGATAESIELVLRANPDAVTRGSKSGRAALHFATRCRTRMSPAEKATVIRLLLDGNASAARSPDSDGACLPPVGNKEPRPCRVDQAGAPSLHGRSTRVE